MLSDSFPPPMASLLVLSLALAGCLAPEPATPPSPVDEREIQWAEPTWDAGSPTEEPVPGNKNGSLMVQLEDAPLGAFPRSLVSLSMSEQRAPGQVVSFTWQFNLTEGDEITTNEFAFGPNSIADPTSTPYPHVIHGTLPRQAHTQFALSSVRVAVPEATLFARAHVVRSGETLWSEELRLDPVGNGTRFRVRLPERFEAGVQTAFEVDVVGEREGAVVIHASTAAGAGANFGSRVPADESLDGVFALESAPSPARGTFAFPFAGRWYVSFGLSTMVGRMAMNEFATSPEITVDVSSPERPNVVFRSYAQDPPDCIDLSTVCAGSAANASIALNGKPGSSARVDILATPEGSPSSAGAVVGSATVPFGERASIRFVLREGSWDLLARVLVDGVEIRSESQRARAVEPSSA